MSAQTGPRSLADIRDLNTFQLELVSAFHDLAKRGLARQAAVALARSLEAQLRSDVREETFPHARCLELLMSTVTAALKGNGRNEDDSEHRARLCHTFEQGITSFLRSVA